MKNLNTLIQNNKVTVEINEWKEHYANLIKEVIENLENELKNEKKNTIQNLIESGN